MRKHKWDIIIPLIAVLCTVGVGVTTRIPLNLKSFNAGELSPLMNARSDYPKYASGAKTLQNMLVRPQGPVERRPGTKFIAEVKDATDTIRLIPFEYSTEDSYVLEAGDQYFRVYRNGGQVLDQNSLPYEVNDVPYDSNDLFEVQWAQDSQFVRFVHGDYRPYKLTRNGHAAWAMTPIVFERGPFMDENTDTTVTITPSYDAAGAGDFTDEAGVTYAAGGSTSPFGPAKAFDNILGAQSGWKADTFIDNWISVQFLAGKVITKINIQNCWDTASPLDQGRQGLVQGSNNGSSWTKVPVSAYLGACQPANTDEFHLDHTTDYVTWATLHLNNAISYTYYRLFFYRSWHSAGGFIAVNEIEMMTSTAGVGLFDATLDATEDIFDSGHVDSVWQISHYVDANSVSQTFNTTSGSFQASTSLTIVEDRRYDFTTSGQWTGTVRLQRSYDSGVTWEDVTVYTSSNSGNLQWSGQETQADALYRFGIDASHTGLFTGTLTARSYIHEGVVQITGYTDANTVSATVIKTLASTAATYRWSEGAWSDFRGWPRTISHHEQRCVYGGSASFPQTVWASIIASSNEDYDNFDDGNADDDDAWTFVLPGMNPIQWMVSEEFLMLGTTQTVGRMGAQDEPITPTSVAYKMQAFVGSDYIQAVYAVDGILFVERGGQKVREVAFRSYNERYVADDMTILAEHITGTGITEIDFQHRPDPVLWCVRDDGQLLSFTYASRHDVSAWARQTEAGTFESVASIPGTDEDVVYTVVSRTIDSNSTKYVENFAPVDWGTDQNDCWFVDSGVTDGNSLSHLEGEEVTIFADGRPIGEETVSSGAITASGYTNYVIGLPYTSIYESMPLVSERSQSLLRTVVITVNMDFQETLGCNLGWDATHTNPIQFSDDAFATTVGVFTGIKTATFPRGISRDMTIYIDVNDPVPMKLRAINPQMEVMSD